MIKNNKGLSSVAEFFLILIIAFIIRSFGYGLYRVPTGSMETTMLVGELFFADKFSILFQKPQHGDIIAFNDPGFIYSDNATKRLFQKYLWGPQNWTKRVIGCPGDRVSGVVENGKPLIYLNDKKLNEHYLNTYPLIGVWKCSPDELKNAKIGTDYQRLGNLYSFKSFDEEKSFDKQPWYEMEKERVMRWPDGSVVMRRPATPLRPERFKKVVPKGNFWDGSDNFYIELGENQYWVMGDNRLNSHDSRAFGPLDGEHIHGKIRFRIASIDSDASWMLVDLIKNPIAFFKKFRLERCMQPVS